MDGGALPDDPFWHSFVRMRPALLGRKSCSSRPLVGDELLTIPPVPPARPSATRGKLPARLVLVGVRNPDRPLRLRHTIAYVDARHLRAIEREWRLVATTIDAGEFVEGVYLLTGRA